MACLAGMCLCCCAEGEPILLLKWSKKADLFSRALLRHDILREFTFTSSFLMHRAE